MSYLKLSYKKRALQQEESPHSFFERLGGDYAFLLESTNGGRYSYIGYDPFLFVWSQNSVVQLEQRKDFPPYKKSAVRQIVEGEPLQILRDLFKKFEYKGNAPVPFYGGGVGFFTYDFGCHFVGVEQKVFDDLQLPDFGMSFVDKVIAFDHETNEVYFLAIGETDTAAQKKMRDIENDLQRQPKLTRLGSMGELRSNLNEKQYVEKIKILQQHIYNGETYQVNFSQRFSGDCSLDPWSVYKKLSQKSPAPFACYFQHPDFYIVSSSPELLLRKREMRIETWPIKGTAPRGLNLQEEQKNMKQLLNSVKDNAELTMIVDLERNDLGKVCEAGSVRVEEHRTVQKLSHIFHTYSRVSGTLDRKKDIFDALQALFPGGSITGCPKKRTMQIIDEFEDYKRGVYTGSLGYLNFSGDGDLNILIRTLLFKDEKVFLSVGGGIVTDSIPEKEYEETLHKAAGLCAALDSVCM